MNYRLVALLLVLATSGCLPTEDVGTTTVAGPQAFETARQPYTLEEGVAKLFFTRPGLERGAEEDPEVDDAIVEAIEGAQSTIDLCLYEFDREVIVEAVVAAADRGVQIRFAGDGDEDHDDGYIALENAGVDLILRKPRDRIMHNKFVVIDNSIVFTGSMNFSENGLLRNNNHAMRIDSPDVAAAYTAEFEQMYVERKFGTKKEPLGMGMPVGVGNTPAEIYFSPQDDIDEKVRARLADADSSVYFMIFSFTHEGISDDLIALREAGVDVVGVYDESQARGRYSSDEKLATAGVPVFIDGNHNNIGFAGGKLHHKVMIIDGNTDSDPTVIIGSYNWSKSATRYNDENVIIFSGANAAAPFLEEFCSVLSAATPHPDFKGPVPDPCSQLLTPIRINEIMANPEGVDGSEEYVELVNTGTAPVDLSGWTISDERGERHVFEPVVLMPKDALVVYSGTRQGVGRTVASTGALGLTNNADSVILHDANGVLIDRVEYTSAESGVSFNRMPDGASEGDFVLHDSMSTLNESPGEKVDGAVWDGAPRLIINEVMANPTGDETTDEYVELYNPTVNPVNPAGWTLGDSTTSDRHVFSDRTIQPGEVVVVWSGGTRSGSDVAASSGGLGLNNTGDQVALRRNGRFMSAYTFSSTVEGTSWNRDVDGNEQAGFVLHDSIPTATSTSSPGIQVDGSLWAAAPEERVIINELLPNPDGPDEGSEFVEIVNVGTQTLDLTGWVLADAVAERHVFDGVSLRPGEVVVVYDSGSHGNITGAILASTGSLGLNNAGDNIKLFDATGTERDAVAYSSSDSGISLNRSPDGTPNAVLTDHTEVGTGAMSPGTRSDGTAW